MHKAKQPQTIMLPKFRYDEVNERYKAVKEELEKRNAEIEKKSARIAELTEELDSRKDEYEHALSELQVKEIFVEGGIVKEQYEAVIPKMTCKNKEKIALAKAIVQLIKDQQKERGNKNGN